ncbi:MAG TPA: MBL fold metallo-hydrolase [Halobacteria archaeon]|nr:MBL fold metallo-hydrolase [Halobacteria archaeon]
MEITSERYQQVNNNRGANSYVVIIKDVIVIDTSMPGNTNKIINFLTKLGMKPNDGRYMVLTNTDMDHSGSVADLKKMTDTKVAIHSKDAPAVSEKRALKEVKGVLSPIFTIMPKIIKSCLIEPDILLNDGNEIGGLKVIYTPGHTIL